MTQRSSSLHLVCDSPWVCVVLGSALRCWCQFSRLTYWWSVICFSLYSLKNITQCSLSVRRRAWVEKSEEGLRGLYHCSFLWREKIHSRLRESRKHLTGVSRKTTHFSAVQHPLVLWTLGSLTFNYFGFCFVMSQLFFICLERGNESLSRAV